MMSKTHVCKCGKAFEKKDLLRRHIRRRYSLKKHICDFPGCGYKTVQSDHLKVHKRIHSGSRPYSCGVPGCDFTCSQTGSLKRHNITHTGRKLHACDSPDCGYASATLHDLVVHTRKHTGEKSYSCDFPACEYIGASSSNLAAHGKTHTGEKLHACDFPECEYKCTTSGSLVGHKRTHCGEKPFSCTLCEYKSASSSHINRHQITHTLDGQIRRKKQENRLNTLLKGWGYTVDCETTINAKAGRCLTDTPRHFSRLDFRVVECVNAICIIECDEDQHFWYNLSCEMSRMADVRAALCLAGYTLPIHWIRFAPTGKYYVGEKQVKIPRPRREEVLKAHLTKVCSPDFTPPYQESVHYMFYDLQSTEAGPEILLDPDFPTAMKGIVSWHH